MWYIWIKEPDLETRTLDIGYQRICDCEPNKLNCLTPKEWLKCQLGVWQFTYDGRDIRDKNVHPATSPVALAERVISLFTYRGELVLDPFVGSGTTLLEARGLERNAVGFDLKPEYIQLCKERLAQTTLWGHTQQIAICDDARNIPAYLQPDTVALIFTSPPYANLLNRPSLNKSRRERKNEQFLRVEQYSQDPRDLGTLDEQAYAQAMADIFAGLLPLLRPRGHCVINVPDRGAPVCFTASRYEGLRAPDKPIRCRPEDACWLGDGSQVACSAATISPTPCLFQMRTVLQESPLLSRTELHHLCREECDGALVDGVLLFHHGSNCDEPDGYSGNRPKREAGRASL